MPDILSSIQPLLNFGTVALRYRPLDNLDNLEPYHTLCPHNFRLGFPPIERAALYAKHSFIYLELFYNKMVVIDILLLVDVFSQKLKKRKV